MKPIKKTRRVEFQAKRDAVIPDLKKLEAQHGEAVTRAAMRKYLLVAVQTRIKQERIARLQQEIAELEAR